MWDCPSCANVNRARWRGRVFEGVNVLSEKWYTATITAPSWAHKENKSLPVIQKGWARLSRRMRYKAQTSLSYVRVYERHKSGEWHAHFVLNNWYGERFFKDDAHACGLGYMGEHTPIETKSLAVYYATKYMTKLEEPLPKGTRRVQTSQNWVKWRPKNEKGAEFYDDIRERDFHKWMVEGKQVLDCNYNQVITTDDFPYGFYDDRRIKNA